MKFPPALRKLFSPGVVLPERYSRAIAWMHKYTCPEAGIAVSNRLRTPYPEVSGYFIPTLLQWGERELARQYGEWLITCQNSDGSWSDPTGSAPYTFDTGQVLKGLLAFREYESRRENAVRCGCDWLVSQVLQNGCVTTPDKQHWTLPSGRMVPEAIHLYALLPLRVAGRNWGIPSYNEAVDRALDYYASDPTLTSFETLSHFHAYVIEALIDLGRRDLAEEGMQEICRLQKPDGSIAAYSDSGWVCSTGLFQYAVIWYKLGVRDKGDRAFSAATRLQNRSGGFYGSYGWGANYFPREEISWAVKYFLDAFWWKIRCDFDKDVSAFPDSIAVNDGRCQLIINVVRHMCPKKILDAGCGKGRFLRKILDIFPEIQLTGLDLSEAMLTELPEGVLPLCGSILDIPAPDGMYDLVFSVEALEHSVNIIGAISELARVVAPGGTLIVIDKNRECLGSLIISEWEQWFQSDEIADILRQQGFSVHCEYRVPYDDSDGCDNLFLGWIATRL